jgi:hypothetical protein
MTGISATGAAMIIFASQLMGMSDDVVLATPCQQNAHSAKVLSSDLWGNVQMPMDLSFKFKHLVRTHKRTHAAFQWATSIAQEILLRSSKTIVHEMTCISSTTKAL